MPGRGPQTFKKRQKEQERKERRQEKLAKRLAKKTNPQSDTDTDTDISPSAETDNLENEETGAEPEALHGA